MTKTLKSILFALIAFFVLAGAFVLVYHQNSVKSQEIAKYEQNWKATKDSLKYYQLKNGEYMAERASFILSEEEMLKELSMTKDELKDIKKKLNASIAALAKAQAEIRVDTVYTESEIVYIDTDTISSHFSYQDTWLGLAGRFNYGINTGPTTTLNYINMSLPLTIGLTDDYKYFVTTPNPYVHITELTSTINEKSVPKKKHWGIGIGIGPSIGYDFHHKDIYYGLGGTLSINYNF